MPKTLCEQFAKCGQGDHQSPQLEARVKHLGLVLISSQQMKEALVKSII